MEAMDQEKLNLQVNTLRVKNNMQDAQDMFKQMLDNGVPIDEARRLRDGFRVNDLKDRGDHPGPSGIKIHSQFLPSIPPIKSEDGLRQQNIGQFLRPPGSESQEPKVSDSMMKPKREGNDHWRVQNDSDVIMIESD